MGLMYKFKISLYDPASNEVHEVMRFAESAEVIQTAYSDTDAIILDVEELSAEKE